MKQLLEIRAEPEEKRAFLEAIPQNVAAVAYGDSNRNSIGSNSNLTITTVPTNYTDRNDRPIYKKETSSRASIASLKLNDQSIQDRKQSVQLSVNIEDEIDRASIVAYIVPLHEKESKFLRRSRSSDDLSIKQSIIRKAMAYEQAEQEGFDGEENGVQKPLRLLTDRNVISVSCERKRSKSFEASFYQTASKVSFCFLASMVSS